MKRNLIIKPFYGIINGIKYQRKNEYQNFLRALFTRGIISKP